MLGAESFENSAAAARRGPPLPAGKEFRNRIVVAIVLGSRSYRHCSVRAARLGSPLCRFEPAGVFMVLKNSLMAVTGLCLLNACSGEDPGQPVPREAPAAQPVVG